MRYFIDTVSGQLRKSASGSLCGPLVFTHRDLLPMEFVFVTDGVEVTTTVLANNALMKVGIKARAGAAVLLALCAEYTVVGQVISLVFPLNSTALDAFFLSTAPTSGAVTVTFEIEVTAADSSTRQTYVQSQALLRREVISADDVLPSGPAIGNLFTTLFVWFRGAINTLVGGGANCLDAVATVGMVLPTALMLKLTVGGGQLWVLEEDAVTVADGEWVIEPLDFDVDTNPRKWKRFL